MKSKRKKYITVNKKSLEITELAWCYNYNENTQEWIFDKEFTAKVEKQANEVYKIIEKLNVEKSVKIKPEKGYFDTRTIQLKDYDLSEFYYSGISLAYGASAYCMEKGLACQFESIDGIDISSITFRIKNT